MSKRLRQSCDNRFHTAGLRTQSKFFDIVVVPRSRWFGVGDPRRRGALTADRRPKDLVGVPCPSEDRERPNNFVFVSGTGHQLAVDVGGSVTQVSIPEATREEAMKILTELRKGLEGDKSLDAATRDDALEDVEAVTSQFKRRRLNKAAVTALISELSQIAAVSELALKLAELVQHMV
jgi:hypothetical protein